MKRVHAFVKQVYDEENEQRVAEPDRGDLPSFTVGDQVLMYDPTHKKGESTKLLQRWKGPYVIASKVTDVTFRVVVNGVEKTIHAERMKKYQHDDVDGEEDEHEQELQRQRRLLQQEMEAIEEVERRMMIKKLDVEQRQQALAQSEGAAAHDNEPAATTNNTTASSQTSSTSATENNCMLMCVVIDIDIN
jgi:hypothetical protein